MLVNSLKYSQLQIILYFLFAHIFVTQAMDPQTTHSQSQHLTFVFNFMTRFFLVSKDHPSLRVRVQGKVKL